MSVTPQAPAPRHAAVVIPTQASRATPPEEPSLWRPDPVTEPIPLPVLPTPQAEAAAMPRAGTPGLAMTRRTPVAAWLGLPLLTLGVYHFVWYYKIHREMAEFDRRRFVPRVGPLLVILLLPVVTLGIAPLVSYFNTGNRIADAQRAAGLEPTCRAGLGLLLCFAFGAHVWYYQSELNKIVDTYGVPAGSVVTLRG